MIWDAMRKVRVRIRHMISRKWNSRVYYILDILVTIFVSFEYKVLGPQVLKSGINVVLMIHSQSV